jgi:hypothetical protein
MSGQARREGQRLLLLPSQLLQDFSILLRALSVGSAVGFVGLCLVFHDFLSFLRV